MIPIMDNIRHDQDTTKTGGDLKRTSIMMLWWWYTCDQATIGSYIAEAGIAATTHKSTGVVVANSLGVSKGLQQWVRLQDHIFDTLWVKFWNTQSEGMWL